MKKYEEGQILLIVVLVMTIALTIGLSVATRTITNIRTSADQEQSERAFSAAEAGVEQALQSNTNTSGSFSNNAQYQTSVNTVIGQSFLLRNGVIIPKDDAADVWFAQYPTYATPWTGTVTLYWGQSSDVCNPTEATNTMAALEIVLISGTKANPLVAHYPVDPCNARTTNNHFEFIPSAGGVISGQNFGYRKTIVVTSGLLMRIIPLYAGTKIGVIGCNAGGTGCTNLPAQGTVISSVGTADTTQRKIVGIKENPKLPVQFFPFVVFSPK
jgi:hypothetical protein